MELRLLPRPAEYHLEYVRDVSHKVHRVVPANNQVARLQAGPGLVFGYLNRSGPHLGCRGLNHKRKIKEERLIVERGGPSGISNDELRMTNDERSPKSEC